MSCWHNFKPRYTEVSNGLVPTKVAGHMSEAQIRAMLYRKVYVHDICIKCGEIRGVKT